MVDFLIWDRKAVIMFRGPIRTVGGHVHEYNSEGKCKFCVIEYGK